jgi:hypothetical protein
MIIASNTARPADELPPLIAPANDRENINAGVSAFRFQNYSQPARDDELRSFARAPRSFLMRALGA